MPHADTAADVTARALAAIEQARDIHAAIPPENPFEAITLHGMQIAAAAVRLTMAEAALDVSPMHGAGRRAALDAVYVAKAALDAEIRAAGEATP